MLSPPPEMKILSVLVKISWKIEIALFPQCAISHEFVSNILWMIVVVHWDKTQMLQKFPSDKINVTKNALFFHSRAPTHHSFTFKSRFLYELKHKLHICKSICGISHFRFRLVFIKVYIFVQQKAWTLWLYNIIIPRGVARI